MKRFLVSLCSIALATALMIFSVGCSQKVYLSFNNNFNGGGESGEPNTQYTEILTYQVKYTENYNDRLIVKDSDLTEQVIKFKYENGSYTQTFEVLPFLPEEVASQTDISVADTKIYHLKTLFKITATYDVNDGNGEKSYNDQIETDAYFLPAGQSFAPIYSSVKSNCSQVELSGGKARVMTQETQSVIVYNTASYKTSTTATLTNGENTANSQNQKDYEYDYRQVIDNTEFLFALRGLTVNEQSHTDISVVSPSYGEPKTLRITHGGALSTTVQAVINGKDVNESVAVTSLSYQLNTTRNSGAPQYVLLQSAKSENIPFKALPVEFAQTLTTYGTFSSMGGLVYSLTSVDIVNG